MPKGFKNETEESNKPVNELSLEELDEGMKQILSKDKKTLSALGQDYCLMSSYGAAKSGRSNDYRQVRFKGTKYYVHNVAAWYKIRLQQLPIPDVKLEVSHLCHQRLCYNPKHLVFEDGLQNKSRLCCELYKEVNGYFCPHSPTCLGAKPCAN